MKQDKPDYSHIKKILTALEEGKIVEVHLGMDGWSASQLNHGDVHGVLLRQLNDPTFYRVAKDLNSSIRRQWIFI